MREEEKEIFATKLEELFHKSSNSSLIYETTMHVEDGSGDFS